MKLTIEGHKKEAVCLNCEQTKECMVLKTKEIQGPHCAECAMKEVRKRAQVGNGS